MPRHASIIATTCLSPTALRPSPGFDHGLFLWLAACPVILPDFAARRADIGAIAQICLDQIAVRCNMGAVRPIPQAIAEIKKTALEGNLVELVNWLTAGNLTAAAPRRKICTMTCDFGWATACTGYAAADLI